MKIVAVCNTKGGVGKSTLCAALAVRAAKTHARVAVIDLDAQRSLAKFMSRRPNKENPEVFADEDSPATAVEKVHLAGFDLVFLDGPPSFIDLIAETVAVADVALVPLLPSMVDLDSTSDAIALVRRENTPCLAVINRGDHKKLVESTRALLVKNGVDVANTVIGDRVSHVHGWAVGKTAAEVNGGRDKDAAAQIDGLWMELAKRLGVKP